MYYGLIVVYLSYEVVIVIFVNNNVTGPWTVEREGLVCVSGMFWVLWIDEDVDGGMRHHQVGTFLYGNPLLPPF